MAQRRMFSKSITNSSQFLMMPQSSQNLYFHLGMNADDDGFCEHFTIMRMTESKPDDLKILQAKGYINIFDDKVLVILDWKENNYLRNDRYTPSKYLAIYKDELKGLPSGIPVVDQTETQDRLGKDRLGKDSNTPLVSLAKIDFPIFWEIYPNKSNKKKTELKWSKLDLKTQQFVIADLKKRVLGEKWMKDGGKFVEMPLTYLNGERWNDEIITPVTVVNKTHRI